MRASWIKQSQSEGRKVDENSHNRSLGDSSVNTVVHSSSSSQCAVANDAHKPGALLESGGLTEVLEQDQELAEIQDFLLAVELQQGWDSD